MCRIIEIRLMPETMDHVSCSSDPDCGTIRWKTRNADLAMRIVHCLAVQTSGAVGWMRQLRLAYGLGNVEVVILRIRLLVPIKDPIDYAWDYRISFILMRSLEMEKLLWSLSTLGGAFSAMGDYSKKFAEVAGKLSMDQLRIAMEMGDPVTISRCKLYMALSLAQREDFRLAMRIVRNEYRVAKYELLSDFLINCCRGVWVKVTYCRWLNRNGLPVQKPMPPGE